MANVTLDYARFAESLESAGYTVGMVIRTLSGTPHASTLNRAVEQMKFAAEHLSRLPRLGLFGPAGSLGRAVDRAHRKATRLERRLDAAVGRTIRLGPVAQDRCVERARTLHSSIINATNCALMLAYDPERADPIKRMRSPAAKKREMIPFILVDLAARFQPIHQRSRYAEEFRTELYEQQDWLRRFLYALRVALRAWNLRASLSATPRQVPAATAGDGEL